jgi:hypothetical protein
MRKSARGEESTGRRVRGENHGFAVRMLKADRVGYVACEDEWQAAGDPFSDVEC